MGLLCDRSDMSQSKSIRWLGFLTLGVNISLMLVKITVGLMGNCYALIADGVESLGDIITSSVTWLGFHFSLRPADAYHPYEHGKIESLVGVFSGFSLLAVALLIAFQAVRELLTPHASPAWYTLPVLLMVVLVKEAVSRAVLRAGRATDSLALEGDAWHHRSDALTSAAAAVGISLALLGGPRFAQADDWAALLACGIIVFNAVRILRKAFHEMLDGDVGDEMRFRVMGEARGVPQVDSVSACRIRKSGTDYFVEVHIQVPGDLSVREGHAVGHQVRDAIMAAKSAVRDVVVHVEPVETDREGDGTGP